MKKKKFIMQLDVDQLKTLIILGLAECDRQTDDLSSIYLFGVKYLEDLELTIKEWDDFICVTVLDAKNSHHIAIFNINDFSMIIDDCATDLSDVLKKYLANQFQDYINYLYEARINEAKEEMKMLLKDSPDILEMYRPKGFFEKKDLSDCVKVKTIVRN